MDKFIKQTVYLKWKLVKVLYGSLESVCLKICVANEISCSKPLKILEKTYGDLILYKKTHLICTRHSKKAMKWFVLFGEILIVFFDIRG